MKSPLPCHELLCGRVRLGWFAVLLAIAISSSCKGELGGRHTSGDAKLRDGQLVESGSGREAGGQDTREASTAADALRSDSNGTAKMDSHTAGGTVLNPISGNNNQVQINAALAGGGKVHLNAGTYIINDSVKLTNGNILEGDRGAILKVVDNANWMACDATRYSAAELTKCQPIIDGRGRSNVRITGFEIDGSQASNGGHSMCGKYYYTMFYFTKGATNVEIDHMYMHDNLNDIITFGDTTSTATNLKFHDNTVRKEGHDIVYAIHAKDVWVYNNDLRISCNSGARADRTKPMYVYNNEIASDGGGYAAIEIQGDSEVWNCNNNIHDTPTAIANLSNSPIHTTGCPTPGPAEFPPAT